MKKPSYEWNEEDILMLIKDDIKESLYLDYKRCEALRPNSKKSKEKIIRELSKDVSSFANADGGTIVYGVIEENNSPKDIDDNPFSKDEPMTREWLENVIDYNIRRKIDKVRINQIELYHKNPGKHIYVVDIPPSLQGAHQANDFKYYQRRNFKAEPMEDFQIRDVMNRQKSPQLDLIVFFYTVDRKPQPLLGLSAFLVNIGHITAMNFGFDLYFPIYFSECLHFKTNSPNIFSNVVEADRKEFWKISFRNGGSISVLFPTEKVNILGERYGRLYFKYDQRLIEAKPRVKWNLFADNMIPREGEISIFTDSY